MRVIFCAVVDSANGHTKPSGTHGVKSGYPSETGYGHEEWNGSDHLQFMENGTAKRVIHSEYNSSRDGLVEIDEEHLVFYYVPKKGGKLVGIAARAKSLHSENAKSRRNELVSLLDLDKLKSDAWDVSLVQQKYSQSKAQFLKAWKADLHWIPNWECPEKYFVWFDEPLKLDPLKITGKSKLLSRYGTHTNASVSEAHAMLSQVPAKLRTKNYDRIVGYLKEATFSDFDKVIDDLKDVTGDESLSNTERTQLIKARIGQGKFRQKLETRWDGACAVTGATTSQSLRASHIMPWSECNNFQRLDGNNGLLLSATMDALFDRKLISFSKGGQMLISKTITYEEQKRLGLGGKHGKLRKPLTVKELTYMKNHRMKFKAHQRAA